MGAQKLGRNETIALLEYWKNIVYYALFPMGFFYPLLHKIKLREYGTCDLKNSR